MNTRVHIFTDEFGVLKEPSVLSANANERKFARRLRIQRRREALQRLEEDVEDMLVEESLAEKQILASAVLLEKLIAEGDEVLSNIRVANDARETERRKEASLVRDRILKELDGNAEKCKQQFDEINDRWAEILKCNDPLDINSEMESQKKRCAEMLGKKDLVIVELQQELKGADEKYFQDNQKQKNDIKLLIERIENQMSTMENVYSRELELIEKTLTTERDDLVRKFQNKWEEVYKELEDQDAVGDEKRNEVMKMFEENMETAMTEHDEEYRAQKINLEKECQALQVEVEKTKAVCLLNAEKLSYNYTVLKSREEENSIVKNQQKRKINKLQGIINNLKKKFSDLEEHTKLEIEKLSSHVLKSHRSITELEEKSIHFTRINEKQYLDIWNMNSETAEQLVKKILAADKIIHERTLGILWEPPEKSLPRKEDLPSYCSAMNTIQKRKQEEVERLKIFDHERKEKSLLESNLEKKVLNNILTQISNCSGYLIEDKLQQLISNRTEEEKTIIRLDNVFQALSITTPEEIDMLLDFFLPYAYCPTCSAKHSSSNSSSLNKLTTVASKSTCVDICDGCTDDNVKKLVDTVKEKVKLLQTDGESDTSTLSNENLDPDQLFDKDFTSTNVDEKSKRLMCNEGHVLEIQAAHVTKAMREVVTKCTAAEQKDMLTFEERLKEKKYTISRNLSVEDVTNYWSNYREIFGTQKEKLWDAILMGLNKYYEVLKIRHKLCTEAETLKQQNEELQRLLKSHLTSPDELSLLQIKSTKHSTCSSKHRILA